MTQQGSRAPASEALLLVQDLANTLDVETGADALAAPGGLGAFLREHDLTRDLADGLAAEPAERPGEAPAAAGAEEDALAEVVELREALRAACLAHTGTDLSGEESATLRRLLDRAPLTLAVDLRGRAALRPAGGLTGTAALTARIAAGIAAAAADGTWPRLKACAAHDCRWVYYDRSPAGRGRWCSMAVCGSRAKMRTYRAAKAAASAPAPRGQRGPRR